MLRIKDSSFPSAITPTDLHQGHGNRQSFSSIEITKIKISYANHYSFHSINEEHVYTKIRVLNKEFVGD